MILKVVPQEHSSSSQTVKTKTVQIMASNTCDFRLGFIIGEKKKNNPVIYCVNYLLVNICVIIIGAMQHAVVIGRAHFSMNLPVGVCP